MTIAQLLRHVERYMGQVVWLECRLTIEVGGMYLSDGKLDWFDVWIRLVQPIHELSDAVSDALNPGVKFGQPTQVQVIVAGILGTVSDHYAITELTYLKVEHQHVTCLVEDKVIRDLAPYSSATSPAQTVLDVLADLPTFAGQPIALKGVLAAEAYSISDACVVPTREHVHPSDPIPQRIQLKAPAFTESFTKLLDQHAPIGNVAYLDGKIVKSKSKLYLPLVDVMLVGTLEAPTGDAVPTLTQISHAVALYGNHLIYQWDFT